MVDYLKTIEDRDKRNEQARAIIKVMEILNPSVHLQDDYEHKLWDHLFITSGFDLDVDAPYPMPAPESLNERPRLIPIQKRPVKASHYGRNIENMIELVAGKEDGETKTAMIRALAIYMRQQYLIWNKDTVTDQTIFQDIERLSDFRIKVPADLTLNRVGADQAFSRPGQNSGKNGKNNNFRKNNQKKRNNNQHK
jgi:hypothetical protein